MDRYSFNVKLFHLHLHAGLSRRTNNSVIGRIRRNANGFHNPKAFITMIVLARGSLAPDLPWAA